MRIKLAWPTYINLIQSFWNNLDHDQKDVLKSTLLVTAISAWFALFLDGALVLIFIIFPLQLIVTGEIFANSTVAKAKGFFIDKKSKKAFRKSIAVLLTCGGLILIALSIIVSARLNKASFLAFFVLFVPLFITRFIVFFYKLPLSVMYCLIPKLNLPIYDEQELHLPL